MTGGHVGALPMIKIYNLPGRVVWLPTKQPKWPPKIMNIESWLSEFSPIKCGDPLPPVDCPECEDEICPGWLRVARRTPCGDPQCDCHIDTEPCEHCTDGVQNRVAGPVNLVSADELGIQDALPMANKLGFDLQANPETYLCSTIPEVIHD